SPIISVPNKLKMKGRFACRLRRNWPAQVLNKDDINNPALESLRSLRAVIQAQNNEENCKILAFIGATAQVGKEFIAINTTSLLAIEGKKVILVDANLRCSHVHNYFNYERGAAGLADLLANKATSRQALIRKKNGFHVLPAGIMDRGN